MIITSMTMIITSMTEYYLNDNYYYLNDKGKVESLGDKDRNSKSRFLSRLRKKINRNYSQVST